MPITRLDALAAALGSSPAAVCAMQEGLTLPISTTGLDGDLTVDYTPEAGNYGKHSENCHCQVAA